MPGGGGIGGGTMTTAGNLVFQVLSDGRLLAYSADKGEKLLEIQTGLRSGMGPPITYRARRQAVRRADGRRRHRGARQRRPGKQATPFSPKLLTFALDAAARVRSTVGTRLNFELTSRREFGLFVGSHPDRILIRQSSCLSDRFGL